MCVFRLAMPGPLGQCRAGTSMRSQRRGVKSNAKPAQSVYMMVLGSAMTILAGISASGIREVCRPSLLPTGNNSRSWCDHCLVFVFDLYARPTYASRFIPSLTANLDGEGGDTHVLVCADWTPLFVFQASILILERASRSSCLSQCHHSRPPIHLLRYSHYHRFRPKDAMSDGNNNQISRTEPHSP
jgi:hypothetical protein